MGDSSRESETAPSTGRWLLLLIVLVVVGWIALFLFTTAGWSDPGPELAAFCRHEYDLCAGQATSLTDSLHCRIELRHCRNGQHFERLDGTTLDVPSSTP